MSAINNTAAAGVGTTVTTATTATVATTNTAATLGVSSERMRALHTVWRCLLDGRERFNVGEDTTGSAAFEELAEIETKTKEDHLPAIGRLIWRVVPPAVHNASKCVLDVPLAIPNHAVASIAVDIVAASTGEVVSANFAQFTTKQVYFQGTLLGDLSMFTTSTPLFAGLTPTLTLRLRYRGAWQASFGVRVRFLDIVIFNELLAELGHRVQQIDTWRIMFPLHLEASSTVDEWARARALGHSKAHGHVSLRRPVVRAPLQVTMPWTRSKSTRFEYTLDADDVDALTHLEVFVPLQLVHLFAGGGTLSLMADNVLIVQRPLEVHTVDGRMVLPPFIDLPLFLCMIARLKFVIQLNEAARPTHAAVPQALATDEMADASGAVSGTQSGPLSSTLSSTPSGTLSGTPSGNAPTKLPKEWPSVLRAYGYAMNHDLQLFFSSESMKCLQSYQHAYVQQDLDVPEAPEGEDKSFDVLHAMFKRKTLDV